MAPTAYARMRADNRKKARQAQKTKEMAGTRMAVKYGYCGAKKHGVDETCRQAAGWGTDHLGYGKCKFHGGNLPSHKASAIKQEVVLMGGPKDINPLDALIWCIKITAGEVEWLTERMHELDKSDWYEQTIVGKQLHILAKERADRVSRLAKYSATAISLGIAERAVRMAEHYGHTLARLLKGVLEDLQLTPEQQKQAPIIIRKHLVLIEGANPKTDADRPSAVAAIPERVSEDPTPREPSRPRRKAS